ncbi:metal ABC transporter solute-binding protein, Zn/Mn family [Anoxynatronum buryatiense]|uniref:Manganese/zinc/iron transport system substrate-binding protein n=1 Tax=Anoxynatronum buryatiense TaxID=489973 RepID=A0AA46AJQ3_9CLOT|nr:zinc ABC transporter substrate-binding protein [Anoxynatronum buryatiense]SMP63535.1 manganese/zinc/iron transport system substrate-binding protein [Anoxynatronum buryatiense]
MKKWKLITVIITAAALAAVGCSSAPVSEESDQYQVVATTTMLADLARVIGSDHVTVTGLMGPGIDPHLYSASAGDVETISSADLILYNGLHLEAKLGEVFSQMRSQNKKVVAVAEALPEELFLESDEEDEIYDPHIWFDVQLWKMAAEAVQDALIDLDEANADAYRENYEAYATQLDELDAYILSRVEELPEASRVLITAHDAFAYFGEAYGFEVLGLQGISTVSEAGTADIRELADYIYEKQIKAIFIESSVPTRSIEAVQEAVSSRGFDTAIGGELYSDSLGSAGTDAETYIGTVRANIDTIVDALK